MAEETTGTVPASTVATTQTFSLGALVGCVLVALLLGASVALNFHLLHSPPNPPSPTVPTEPVDASFVVIGKSLAPTLAPGYAVAWLAGDQALAAGKPFSQAFAAVNAKWSDTRQSAFAASVQAAIDKIIPAGTTDDKITAQQVAACRAAFRGLAEGLNGGKLPAVQFIPLRFTPPSAQSEPKAVWASRSLEVKAVLAESESKPKPKPDPAPVPAEPETDRWSWEVIAADPRLEGWGHMEGGTWVYYQTRWRS